MEEDLIFVLVPSSSSRQSIERESKLVTFNGVPPVLIPGFTPGAGLSPRLGSEHSPRTSIPSWL